MEWDFNSVKLIDLLEPDRPMGHSARQLPDGELLDHPALQQPNVLGGAKDSAGFAGATEERSAADMLRRGLTCLGRRLPQSDREGGRITVPAGRGAAGQQVLRVVCSLRGVRGPAPVSRWFACRNAVWGEQLRQEVVLVLVLLMPCLVA